MHALSRITQKYGRNVMTKFIRNESNGGGIPGENLPFDIHNKARITFNFFWFGASGIGIPFLVVLHQIRKN